MTVLVFPVPGGLYSFQNKTSKAGGGGECDYIPLDQGEARIRYSRENSACLRLIHIIQPFRPLNLRLRRFKYFRWLGIDDLIFKIIIL